MFLEKPHFEIGNSNTWVVTKAGVYASPMLGYTIRVPEGFSTDLASIPRIFTRVLPVNDSHRLAAVVHDYLYSLRGKLPNAHLTRKTADRVFLEAMEATEVPVWKRWAMYNAVRVGGWVPWGAESA